MTQPDPAAVAASLTEAQRLVVSGPVRHTSGLTLACCGTLGTLRALQRKGVLAPHSECTFTPFGRQVRQIITKEGE